MLALTVGLGVWQVQRLAWKTALLSEFQRAEAAPAIPLPPRPQPFAKVRVEGLLRRDQPALYGVEVRTTAAGPTLGAFLLNPLERPGAPPVIIDRGWVPAADAPRGETPTPATIEGYVREPDRPSWFSAADNPGARRFYVLDAAAIGAALGLPRVAPFVVVALGNAPRGTYPEPAQTLPRPPNSHLGYALTWFGLAAALLAMFGVQARRILKAPP